MLKGLAMILFVLLLVFGGERGAISVIALAGNIVVLFLTIFFLATGMSPLLVIPVACILVCLITLHKQNGKNAKTKAAFLAVAAVMVVMTPIIYLATVLAQGGGFHELRLVQEDLQLYFQTNLHINMLQITVAVVLLSALGAVIDTALAVSSVVYEVNQHTTYATKKMLFETGMKVGRDIIGTTANTLLFAYLGESILLAAYLQKGIFKWSTILNSKFLYQEIAVMLFGLVACVLAVPASSYGIASYLEKENHHKKKCS